MNRFATAAAALILAAGIAPATLAQDTAEIHGRDRTTGATNPADIIAARQALMLELEELMRPIDTYTVDPGTDPTGLAPAARTIAAMLLAFPHLFMQPTNLYDPDADSPATLALPRIWEEFPAFYAMARASSTAASTMAETDEPEALRMASAKLRASCDACHGLYLRPYVASTASEQDRAFDFDSLFDDD